MCVVEFWDDAGKADNVAVLKIEEYVSICCFILYNYITMHGAKHIKFAKKNIWVYTSMKNIKNLSSKLSKSYYIISSRGSCN